MKDFRKLQAWQKARHLTLTVYKAARAFPAYELYGLSDQVRRSCVSVCANSAEGCGREGDAEFRRFLHIASDSANELQCCLMLARDLGFLPDPEYLSLDQLIDEIEKMLTCLAKRLEAGGWKLVVRGRSPARAGLKNAGVSL